MILHRKVYSLEDKKDFSIWLYDTKNKMEKLIFDNKKEDQGNEDNYKWGVYKPIGLGQEKEVRISKKDAQELIFLYGV